MFNFLKNIYEYLHIQLIEHNFIKIDFDFIMCDIIYYISKEKIYILSWLKRKGCFNDIFVCVKDVILVSIHEKCYKSLKWICENFKLKKVIKMAKITKYFKTIKFKTKNNYIKGYNKN